MTTDRRRTTSLGSSLSSSIRTKRSASGIASFAHQPAPQKVEPRHRLHPTRNCSGRRYRSCRRRSPTCVQSPKAAGPRPHSASGCRDGWATANAGWASSARSAACTRLRPSGGRKSGGPRRAAERGTRQRGRAPGRSRMHHQESVPRLPPGRPHPARDRGRHLGNRASEVASQHCGRADVVQRVDAASDDGCTTRTSSRATGSTGRSGGSG